MKNLFIFAVPKRKKTAKGKDWCGSSAWLEYLPVTQGVAGSSPVRTAEEDVPKQWSSSLFLRYAIISPKPLERFID